MTAEIVIMNKEAIALASDSAVTMTGETDQKVFTSANKIFALSKFQPVGVMIYGNSIFMGVPWETIIKIYRKNLNIRKFDTLEKYATHFIQFLDKGNPLFLSSVQKDYLQTTIFQYFDFIKDDIQEQIHSIHDKKGKIQKKEIDQVTSEVIKNHYEKWEKSTNIQSIPKSFNKYIVEKNKRFIDNVIKEIFEKLPLYKIQINQLKKIAGNLFSRFPEEFVRKENISGVVIAGFGEKDTFPSLVSFDIDGIAYNKLKFKKHISEKIDFETSAWIIPFAQREMVVTFMEGVDPSYKNVEESYLSKIFNEYTGIIVDSLKKITDREKEQLKRKLVPIGTEILKDYWKELGEYSREKHVLPIIRVVSMLPRDELAAMAESLVNLTSFKRKITLERETVGGPIDVALISKGDGFIWIKRKHYFKPELNPQFFANYNKEI